MGGVKIEHEGPAPEQVTDSRTSLTSRAHQVKAMILAEGELSVVLLLGVVVGVLASLSALWGRSGGYTFGLIYALSYLCMNNFVRLAGTRGGMPAGFCMLVRTMCLTCGSGLLGRLREEPVVFLPDSKTLRVRLFMRAGFGCCSVMSLFFAVDHIPMLLVLAISCTSSVWSALFSNFTSEPLSRTELMIVVLGVISVLLIMDPMALADLYKHGARAGSMNWLGLCLGALSALAEALAGVTSRSLRGEVHHVSMMFAQALFGALVCLACAVAFPELFLVKISAVGLYQLCLLVGLALSSFVMQLTLNQAYLLEKTAPLQVFFNSAVILPQLALDFVFGRRLGVLSSLGIVMLFMYLALTWLATNRREKQSNTAARGEA